MLEKRSLFPCTKERNVSKKQIKHKSNRIQIEPVLLKKNNASRNKSSIQTSYGFER